MFWPQLNFCAALQPHPSQCFQKEVSATLHYSCVYNLGSIITSSLFDIIYPHTHCQLQAEYFSSVQTPACPRAFTENAEQCECSNSLSAWRLRTLGCVLSSLWMCGIGDVAHSDGSIVRAESIPSRISINNRKMRKKEKMHKSTVSLLAASTRAFEDASFLSSQQMFLLCHMVCIPCADIAAG